MARGEDSPGKGAPLETVRAMDGIWTDVDGRAEMRILKGRRRNRGPLPETISLGVQDAAALEILSDSPPPHEHPDTLPLNVVQLTHGHGCPRFQAAMARLRRDEEFHVVSVEHHTLHKTCGQADLAGELVAFEATPDLERILDRLPQKWCERRAVKGQMVAHRLGRGREAKTAPPPRPSGRAISANATSKKQARGRSTCSARSE